MAWYDKLLGIESAEGKRKDFLEDRQETAETYMGQANKFDAMSDDFFDPNSALNNQRFGILQSAIQDQTASGIRDYQAEMARQGQNIGASGVGVQNILQARRRAGGDSANAMNKAYLDSFGLGMNAAKMGTTQRQLGDQIYAGANQVKMQQDSINANKTAGLMQTMAGSAMNMLAPGVGSLLGDAMTGLSKGEGMLADFAKPYADQFTNTRAIQDNFSGMLRYAANEYIEPQRSGVETYYPGSRMPFGGQRPPLTGQLAGYGNLRLGRPF